MYRNLKIRRHKAGSAMLAAMVFMVMMSVLGIVLYDLCVKLPYQAVIKEKSVNAFHIAEAGIAHATASLLKSGGYKGIERYELGDGFFSVKTLSSGNGSYSFESTGVVEKGISKPVTAVIKVVLKGSPANEPFKSIEVESWYRER